MADKYAEKDNIDQITSMSFSNIEIPGITSIRKSISVANQKEEKTLLEEGGFDEFPYMVPRWSKVAGEIYGRSPSMTSLPDIKINCLPFTMKCSFSTLKEAFSPPVIVALLFSMKTFSST